MMHLNFSLSGVEFRLDKTLAGQYRHTDAFKPHIHPLCTPMGHCLTSASPHDHKHHKALMYALRAEDVNFWEEESTTSEEVVGVQKHLKFSKVVSRGSIVGFTESLSWRAANESLASFDETRQITCRHDPSSCAFVWTWRTSLTALRDLHLVQSQWSHRLDDGSKVNYHGLGIRFRRDFGGLTRGHKLDIDGSVIKADFEERMGSIPKSVSFTGNIDETLPVESAGVCFQQEQPNALYVMSNYIPFMSLGPTNKAPMRLSAGDNIQESYSISVYDANTGKNDPS